MPQALHNALNGSTVEDPERVDEGKAGPAGPLLGQVEAPLVAGRANQRGVADDQLGIGAAGGEFRLDPVDLLGLARLDAEGDQCFGIRRPLQHLVAVVRRAVLAELNLLLLVALGRAEPDVVVAHERAPLPAVSTLRSSSRFRSLSAIVARASFSEWPRRPIAC